MADPSSHDADLARREVAGQVQTALSSLPPRLRMPILLRYFQDLSYAEMAEALQCSAGTVASRLNQGHKMLAQKLTKLHGGATRKHDTHVKRWL